MDESRPARLLAIGDVHLGTRPSSLPEELATTGLEPRDLSPEAALDGAVERAIQERVDAVVFAGDVVESSNARFEALRPLERAVRQLLEHGIPVLAVAGNHDVDALPRVASRIDGFKLLGARGVWESFVVEREGRPVCELIGWSFPTQTVRESPLAALLARPIAPAHPDLPRVGVLHGDLDASGGGYAPFRRAELDESGLDAWLLGHIHKPSLDAGSARPCGYLGSLVGLDPTETGPHGPWLTTLEGPGRVRVEQLPLAPLRWEHRTLELPDCNDPEDAADQILDLARSTARELRERGEAPRALGLRVKLDGPCPAYREIRARVAANDWQDIACFEGETYVFVNRVQEALALPLDMGEIANGDDPPALLARRLLALRHDGDDARALLDEARAALGELARDRCWAPLAEHRSARDPLADASLRELLLSSGTAALQALLDQRDVQVEPRR